MALLGGPAESGSVTLPEKRVCRPPIPGSTLKKDVDAGGTPGLPLIAVTVPSFAIKLGGWNPSAYTALSTTETRLLVLGALFQEMSNNESNEGELKHRRNGSFHYLSLLCSRQILFHLSGWCVLELPGAEGEETAICYLS